MFKPLEGDDLGVYKSDNYFLVEALQGRVVFSYTKQGNAMTIHFACDRQALRRLKEVFNAFCQWIFENNDWCRMILGVIQKKSVQRMVKKCNCIHIANSGDKKVFMRLR